jgi:hypothetical protein
MSETSGEALAARCREMAARAAAAAESLSMAEWLRVLANGRTVKQALAEAAGHAWELDRETSALTRNTSAAGPHNRERWPVGELLRELCECLGRTAATLAVLPGGAARRALMAEVDAIAAALDEAGL